MQQILFLRSNFSPAFRYSLIVRFPPFSTGTKNHTHGRHGAFSKITLDKLYHMVSAEV